VVADVPGQVVLLDDLVEVVQDLAAGGDGRPAPRLVPVAVGEQVAVRARPGVAVRPPGAAAGVLRLEDHEAALGELRTQPVRGTDAGHAGTDDQDVDVLDVAAALVLIGRGGTGHGRSPQSTVTGSPRQ
jgi:hypothetical protein